MNNNTVINSLRLCILAVTFLSVQNVFAQKLTAKTATIDVGQVLFDSPVTATFNLKNKSSKRVTISNIETSCGCTTATASNTEVQGGKSLSVTATYDAKTLGQFQKQIWIYVEGKKKKPLELTIRGVVVAEVQNYVGSYLYKIGQISADKQDIEFDDVNRGSRPTQEIHILNTTSETIQPVVMHMPSYLSAQVSPTKITPKHSGVITITLLSDKVRDMGLTQTSIYLGKYPGDKVTQDKAITSSVILIPSFDGMTASQDKAGISVSDSVLYLSKMSGKLNKLKGEIVITNTGTAVLNISSLQMFTSGLELSLSKRTIKPGQTAKLKVLANSTELRAQHTRPRILMITNDPNHPKVIIEIKE